MLAATLDGTLWQRLVAESGWRDERFADRLGQMWVSVLRVSPESTRAGDGTC